MMSHSLLVVGLSLINYGLWTPSEDGVGTAIFGYMVAFPTMCILGISLFRYVLIPLP
jgi:hypothetical protein